MIYHFSKEGGETVTEKIKGYEELLAKRRREERLLEEAQKLGFNVVVVSDFEELAMRIIITKEV